MERKNWVLLVIGCLEEGGLTPVQLQKSLFLLGQKITNISDYGKFYDFIAYDYGPFCVDIYYDAEILASEGYIIINRIYGTRLDEYFITAKGLKLLEEIKKEIPIGTLEYICEIISWIKSVTFSQLIKKIYTDFPDYNKNSIFKQ